MHAKNYHTYKEKKGEEKNKNVLRKQRLQQQNKRRRISRSLEPKTQMTLNILQTKSLHLLKNPNQYSSFV